MMNPVDRALLLLRSTPGVVSDRIFAMHGLGETHVHRLRDRRTLVIHRVGGLGFRLVRESAP